jgi:hypothetical protein
MDSKDSDQSPRRCNSCKAFKDLNGDNFKMARNGFSLTCLICLTARQKKFALKKKDKTGQPIASGVSGDCSDSNIDEEEDEDEGEIFSLLSELSIDAFLGAISDTEGNVSSLLACVNLSSLKGLNSKGPREKADALAKKVWQQIKYRFVYHSVYHSRKFPTACYRYHCSQMRQHQHKPKKGRHEGAKLRDKDAMDTFDCLGWLLITITEGSDVVNVKFQHKDDHVPYWNIDVPKDVQDLVHNNPSMTPTQVRNTQALKIMT